MSRPCLFSHLPQTKSCLMLMNQLNLSFLQINWQGDCMCYHCNVGLTA